MAASVDRLNHGNSLRLHSYQRICRSLPNHLILARNQRSERLLCQAIALPHGLHWLLNDLSYHIFKRRQEVRLTRLLSASIATTTRPIKTYCRGSKACYIAVSECLSHLLFSPRSSYIFFAYQLCDFQAGRSLPEEAPMHEVADHAPSESNRVPLKSLVLAVTTTALHAGLVSPI